jgi:hypothetical protein
MLAVNFRCGNSSEEWPLVWQNLDTQVSEDLVGSRDWIDLNWPANGPDGHESSPFRIWRIAHEDCWQRGEDLIYNPRHDILREWGYVIWDAPKTLLPDEELRKKIAYARELSLLEEFRRYDYEEKAKMRKSWKERRQIFNRGGRGYWSKDDLSQILWTSTN